MVAAHVVPVICDLSVVVENYHLPSVPVGTASMASTSEIEQPVTRVSRRIRPERNILPSCEYQPPTQHDQQNLPLQLARASCWKEHPLR